MKSAKIITLIASIFFFLAAIGSLQSISQLRSVVAAGSGGNGNSIFVVPIVEIIFAVGSFLFWLHIRKQEKKGIMVAHACLISITLIVLSIALSWALMTWFILLPVYNLAATAN